MTATSQHGFHPDAESLSAFSEQALGERERGEVLAHLAVCGRCRQVVALTREAADADEKTAAVPPRKIVAPTAWWKQWRLVWVPTAVVAAFAVASISIYIERADRHGSDIKTAEQNPTPGATLPSTPSPTEQAKVEPPAATAPETPTVPAHPAKRAHAAAPERMPAPAPPAVETQMPQESRAPEPGVTNREGYRRETPPISHQEALQAPPEFTAGAMRPSESQQASGVGEEEKKQAEMQRQVEVEKSQMRNLKAKAAPFAGHGANGAQPAGATQTVTVTSALPVETQPAAPAEPAPMLRLKHVWDVPALASRIQLPSGLTAVSTASHGHLLLAIDKAGALFLSDDRGVRWERIATQWTGRAVEVHQQVAASGDMPTASGTQNGTTGNASPDAGAAPPPTVSFELSNDENQTWVSTDGRTWTPK